MKKIISGFVLVLAVLALVACEWEGPPGFDYDFHSDARTDFTEIDDDTAEGESPDRDDLGNFNRNAEKADSSQEEEYVALVSQLIEENKKIVADVNYSTSTYEGIREDIGKVLEVRVYEFEFTEGE